MLFNIFFLQIDSILQTIIFTFSKNSLNRATPNVVHYKSRSIKIISKIQIR